MTTTAITTEQRLQDAAQSIYNRLSPVEIEGIGWFIQTLFCDTQILKFHNELDIWGGSQLDIISSACRDLGLIWWMTSSSFIGDKYTGAKVTVSISTEY